MIRALLDTNVLASGFVGYSRNERLPERLLRLWRGERFELVVSDDIAIELIRTLEIPYFRAHLTDADIMDAHRLVLEGATWGSATTDVDNVATHPEDDRILAAAVSAEVDYLVTGDSKLQRLGSYQGVAIVTPRAFLDMLELQEDDQW